MSFFVGELAIMLDEPNRLVTSVATAPSELFGIRKPLFLQLMGTNAALEDKMKQRAKQVKAERQQYITNRLESVVGLTKTMSMVKNLTVARRSQ